MSIIKKEWIVKYITFRNYFNKGWGEFSWFRNIIERLALIIVGIVALDLPEYLMMLAICGYLLFLIFCYAFGRWWDRRNHWDTESEWSIDRTPTLKNLRNVNNEML